MSPFMDEDRGLERELDETLRRYDTLWDEAEKIRIERDHLRTLLDEAAEALAEAGRFLHLGCSCPVHRDEGICQVCQADRRVRVVFGKLAKTSGGGRV